MSVLVRSKELKMVPLSEIKLNPKNRNTHPKEQIAELVHIIQTTGFRRPVTISNQSGFLSCGEGRFLAAKKLKMKELPAIFQDYDSPDQEYADGIADNAIDKWAALDLSSINNDILDMGPDFDIRLMGIKDFVIEPAEKFEAQCDEDSIPDKVEPKTKLGDLYILGKHRLLCGDSTNIQHVEKLMNNEKADLVFTDPPYGVNYDGGHAEKGKRREKLANDDSTQIYDNSVPLMAAFSKENAALYLWFAATKSLQVLQVLQVLQDNNYEIRSWLIWNKNMAQFGAIGAQYKQKHEPCLYCYKKGNSPFWDGPNNEVSVWDIKRASKNEFHPTQKPVELAERAIKNSCPSDGIVMDLFGGSGATMIAAQNANRKAMLMELSPAYCDVIVARWEKYTGKKAELIPSGGEDGENET